MESARFARLDLVQGSGFMIYDLWLMDKRLGLKVQGLGLKIWG